VIQPGGTESSPPPIVVCYDGSPAAKRAVDAAGTLFRGQPAVILYAFPGVATKRVRTTSVEAVRDELIEEVRAAARHEAEVVADEGARLAMRAGLDAKPLILETGGRVADAVIPIAKKESAVAIVVGLPSRSRRGLLRPGSVSRDVVARCPLPVVVV
jgi:nucleotide-binding universal stress UspA family protein